MSTAFSRLLEVHRELDEIFLLHGECLLTGQLALGQEVLQVYRALLLLHMQHEETKILPLYAELGPAPRFPLVLYTGQHEKLQGMLNALITRMGEVTGDARAVRRGLLALFDQETTFKHLNEHHDGAERDGLFSWLDAHAAPENAARLVRECLDEWWTQRALLEAPLARARAL